MARETKYKQHEVKVSCSCKNTFNLHFTEEMPKAISIEKCNKCHPAYNDALVDTSNTRDKKVQQFNEKCDFSSLFEE